MVDFQENFIRLTPEHYFSLRLDAPGGSWKRSERSWQLLAALGENFKKIVLRNKKYIFHSPGLILTSCMRCILDMLKIHENHCFVDFWIQSQRIIKSSFLGLVLSISGANQGPKVIKSSLLWLVFSTFGAKARKSSNRVFWDWFC